MATSPQLGAGGFTVHLPVSQCRFARLALDAPPAPSLTRAQATLWATAKDRAALVADIVDEVQDDVLAGKPPNTKDFASRALLALLHPVSEGTTLQHLEE